MNNDNAKYLELKNKFTFQTKLEKLVDDEIEKTQIPERIGIANTTFLRAIKHGIIPSMKVLIQIADYFEVSLEFLLSRTEDKEFYRPINPTSFYARLSELRLSKGYKTNYELAKELNLPRQDVYNWVDDKKLPTLSNLEYLAECFDVTLDYLIGRSD